MSRFSSDIVERAMAAVRDASLRTPAPEPVRREASDEVRMATELGEPFEGFVSHPYLCDAGVPTIGFGSTMYEDGRPVTLRDPPITKARARELFAHDMQTRRAPALRRLCPSVDTVPRKAALLDFTYNCGIGALEQSTLRRKVNAGDWDAVPAQLMRWVYGGGRRLQGLVLRRIAESKLI